MRHAALALCLAGLLAVPVQAQRRGGIAQPAPVVLSETPGALSLGALFNAQTLDLSQSYEFSASSGAGGSLGLGIYTTTLRWQPSSKLAGRVDVGVAHSPFGSAGVQSALGFDADTPARVYLRNAELAYRPTESSIVRLSVQQSPFGRCLAPRYGSAYGAAGRCGASSYGLGLAGGDGELFFRDGQ